MTSSIYESLDGHDPLEWIYLFLVRLNVPRSESNLHVGYSWEFWESGGGGGMFNPLNTVQPWPNTTDYNSIGVKNYASWEDGMAATETAILQPRFAGIMAELQAGDDPQALIHEITSSEWGTTIIKFRTISPRPKRERDMIIQPGRKPTVDLMTPYVIPAVDGQHVECWFGAKLINAVPTSNPNLWLWHPGKLAVTSSIVSISRRVDNKDDPASHGETRPGIVVADNTGRCHDGFWQ